MYQLLPAWQVQKDLGLFLVKRQKIDGIKQAALIENEKESSGRIVESTTNRLY